MKKKKVLIVGGGITGLVCANQFKNEFDVELVEIKKLGGDFMKGENKYIHETKLVRNFFDSMDVPFSDYRIRNGILFHGKVEKFDEHFETSNRRYVDRIKRDYFQKTRLMQPPQTFKNSFTEPAYTRPKSAIRVGRDIFVEELVESLIDVKKHFSKAKNIGCKSVTLFDGKILKFDKLILTIPLWEIAKIAWWKIEYCTAVKRNLIKILPLTKNDKYAKWNHVYTPYTPENTIYRLSPVDDSYIAEVSGNLTQSRSKKVISDLYWLFDEWTYQSGATSKGHFVTKKAKSEDWPKNIIPIGMYAQWDEKATLDRILKRIEELKVEW